MFLTAFIFGLLGASLALVIELVILNGHGSMNSALALTDYRGLMAVVAAVIIEESARFLLLRQFFLRTPLEVSASWHRVFFIGLAAGIGFSALETGLILWQGTVPFFPLFGILLVHSALSILFAFAFSKKTPLGVPGVFLLAVLLHFSYNLSLLISER